MRYTEQLKVYCKSAILSRKVSFKLIKPESIGDVIYPLLILNDGQESGAVRIRQTLENLTGEGLIRPVIVAAIHAGNRLQEYGIASCADYAGRGNEAGMYTDFIIKEFVPLLRKGLPVEEQSPHNAIAGYSLGALSAFDIAWNNPAYFGTVGCFSGSFWWRTKEWEKGRNVERFRIAHKMVKASGHVPAHLRLWFQAGTLDETNDRNGNGIIDSIDDTLDLIKELKKHSIDIPRIRYLEIEGGRHHPETWAEAMIDFLIWTFPPEVPENSITG